MYYLKAPLHVAFLSSRSTLFARLLLSQQTVNQVYASLRKKQISLIHPYN